MNEDRHDFLAIGSIVKHPLTRACLAFNDRIHRLEMTGIRCKVNFDLVAGRCLADVTIPEVILHVAVSTDRIRREVSLKFIEDDVKRLVENVGQNVQAAAVGHPHDEFFDPALLTVLHDGIEREDQGFAALQGKTLAAVLRVQKIFKSLCFVEFAKDIAMDCRVGAQGTVAIFQLVEHPCAHSWVLNVHELRADCAAIDGFKLANHLSQLHLLPLFEEPRGDGQIEFLFVEAEFL